MIESSSDSYLSKSIDFDDKIQFVEDYNIHSYPKPIQNGSFPLEVAFQINLRNVLEVNEISQTVTLGKFLGSFMLLTHFLLVLGAGYEQLKIFWGVKITTNNG